MTKKAKIKTFLSKLFALVLAMAMITLCLSGCDEKESKGGGGASTAVSSDGALGSTLKNTDINEALAIYRDLDFKRLTVGADLSVSVTDDFISLLNELGQDEISDLFGLSEAGISVDLSRYDDLIKADLYAKINGRDILGAEVIVDMAGGCVYLSSPELNSQAVRQEIPELAPAYQMSVAMDEYMSFLAEIDANKILNVLISYVDEAMACVDDVESGKETVTADGVSEELNVVTYRVTEKDAYEMGVALLKKLKNDSDVRDLFMDIYPIAEAIASEAGEDLPDASEFYDGQFIPMIDEALPELEEELENTEDGGETIGISVYTDSEGNLKGISAEVEGTTVFKFYTTENGSDIGVIFDIMNEITFSGSGTVDGGKLSGDYAISFEGESIEFGVEELDMGKLEAGLFDGTIVLEGSEIAQFADDAMASGILSQCTFKLKLVDSNERAEMALMGYFNGKLMAEIKLETEIGDNASAISLPSNTIDANDSDAMEQWVSNISFDTILNNLSKAGISEELISQLFGSSIGIIP